MSAATPEQVAAAQEAMGCERWVDSRQFEWCIGFAHGGAAPRWAERGCLTAVAVADAVAAAGPNPDAIQAEGLRILADGLTRQADSGASRPLSPYDFATWLRQCADETEATP